ncbi:MAG: DUF6152 family protein [Pseudohongiellaceae bacterium]|jgi:hypothetical protein
MNRQTVIIGAVLLLAGLPALAHHSNAMFDQDQVLEMTGTVKEFQFTNPHSWIQVMVANGNGHEIEWSLEWGSPNSLGREGIRPSTFPPGKTVMVRTYPMKDGSPGGLFIGARFDDGQTVGNWE